MKCKADYSTGDEDFKIISSGDQDHRVGTCALGLKVHLNVINV